MACLVVIPTYNERENVSALIPQIHSRIPTVDVLVVDDGSPDGTAGAVRSIESRDRRVHLLQRARKQGLGRAYVAGLSWGLERGYSVLVQMDADFSHRPEDLPSLLDAMPEVDFVMGSRWVHGGRTSGWSVGRQLLSRGGSFYTRQILRYPLRDWTGGFNAWTAQALQSIRLESVRSEGYSFQIELKYRALMCGLRGREVPIVFEERRVGQSKMSSRIVREALLGVWRMRGAGGSALRQSQSRMV